MRWFAPKVNDGHIVIRALLDQLPFGDLSNEDRLELYVDPGAEHNRQAVATRAAYLITSALAHRKWTLYMRKKWLGGEEAACEAALGLLLGGVLKPAFKLFFEKKSVGRAGRAGAAPILPSAGPDAAAGEDTDDRPMPPLGAADDDGEMPPPDEDDGSWAARNDRRRRVAMNFLSSRQPSALGRIVAFRMLQSVAQGMQAMELAVGSKRWEKKQAAAAARKVAGGGRPPTVFCGTMLHWSMPAAT